MLNPSIQSLSFDGVLVHFDNDAYLNATAIAKQFNKRVGDYLRNARTQEYIAALGEYLTKNPVTGKTVTEQNQLVILIQGGTPEEQGTWIHPKLAIDFARWLSPRFAVWCDVQIEKILGIDSKYYESTISINQQPIQNIGIQPIRIEHIQRVVSDYFRIPLKELLGSKRNRAYTRPRQLAMGLARELTGESFSDIGLAFWGRDHSTVMYACEKIQALRYQIPSLEMDYKNLMRLLQS